jgi:hypothetical protein
MRLKPDVLSDHVLYRASVSDGRLTGFIDEVIATFSPDSLGNVLKNAGELEWRCKLSGGPGNVLAAFFHTVFEQLPDMTQRERYLRLEALQEGAIFFPEESWRLAEWLIDHPDAPDEQGEFAELLTYPHQMVVSEVPKLLAKVAWHEEFVARCAAMLWELAKQDTRDTNPHPHHPRRALQDLVGYKEGRPFRLQLRALQELRNAVTREREGGQEANVANIVGSALKREGEWAHSDGHGFSIGAIPLHDYLKHEEVEALRRCALDMLKEQALSANAAVALAAVEALDDLLSLPHGLFGRSVTQRERDAWLPEAQAAVDLLVDTANASTHDSVRVRVRLLLQEHSRRKSWPKLSEHLAAAFGRLRAPDDLELYLALLPAWDVHGHGLRHDEIVRRDSELQTSVADTLRSKYGSPGAIVTHLARCAEALHSAGCGPQPYRLLGKLAEREAAGVTQAVIASGSQALQQSILAPMSKWLQTDADQAFAAIVRALDTGEEALSLGIADGYWHDWFQSSDQYPGRHLEILERLVQSPFAGARRLALESLRCAPATHARRAVAMIVGADYGNDAALLDAALGVFDRENGLDPALLTAGEVGTLLAKIVRLDELSGRAYHTGQFLAFACEAAPGAVVDCLLTRIARSASEDSPEGYKPLPYSGFYAGLTALSADPKYPGLLRQTRDAVLRPEWQYHFWVPKLFAFASDGFGETALDVLREWVESGEPDRIVGAARLLENADYKFVFDRHAFVGPLLTQASRAGQECYDHVRSLLFQVAIGGIVESSPGQPAPRYVEEQQRARELAAEYVGSPVISSFYVGLADWVQQQIAASLAEDEELLE